MTVGNAATNDPALYAIGALRPHVGLNGSLWRSPATITALLVLLIAALESQPARAQPPTTPITTCTTIAKSGVYELDASLTQIAPADCIFVKAANVILNLNRQTLSGSGAGAGVHIGPTAANVFVEGDSATVTGFADGIEVDAANAFVDNFLANHNSDAGIYLKGAKQARIANFTSNLNGNDGIRISGGSSNNIQSPNCINNGRYGIWLVATSHNNIGNFDVEDNAIAGIYAGCWTDGPHGVVCKPAVPSSSFNSIYGGLADSNGEYGIAIDLADNGNRVANDTSQFNTTKDMFDANSDCANNLWLANAFGTSDEAPPPIGCIR